MNKPIFRPPTRGFTLLELLIVVAIVAIATAGVSLALRDSSQAQLEAEANRLAALLEGARAQSRASGVAVKWRATADGFVFDGMPPTPQASNDKPPPKLTWLNPNTNASSDKALVLGPEPMIPPQAVNLWQNDHPQYRLQVYTDGIRPFTVRNSEP